MAEQLTDRKERVSAFRWSPDGTRIALLMAEAKTDALEKREKVRDDGRVVDRDERHDRVWLLDVQSKQLVQATSGSWRIEQIEWLPDGKGLIAAATDKPHVDAWNERIYRIDLDQAANGTFHEVAAPRGPFSNVAISPDGQMIAYIGARVDGPEPHDLFVQSTGGGSARNLTHTTVDRPLSQPRWIDNRSLSIHVQQGFKSALAIVDTTGNARIEATDTNPSVYALSTTGAVAFVGETTTRAPELYPEDRKRNASRGHQRQQDLGNDGERRSRIHHVQEFRRRRHRSLLVAANHRRQPPVAPRRPRSWRTDRPLGRQFEPWGQLLAARGYAVLYPNVRGSTGYGQQFVEMNRADWGGGDFKDVMAGVDWLVARGIADPDRLGIGGWSYGGYMAAWAVTQTTRFKAAVSGAPVIDMAQRIRHRKRLRLRRMVLRHALRTARRVHQELADDIRQERPHANLAAAGRG